jgi:hypothetical protein
MGPAPSGQSFNIKTIFNAGFQKAVNNNNYILVLKELATLSGYLFITTLILSLDNTIPVTN